MVKRLYIGNLSFNATEADLRGLFKEAGEVVGVELVADGLTGRPRGFGFVEMATGEEAERAVGMFNQREFMLRKLVVSEARPRPKRDY